MPNIAIKIPEDACEAAAQNNITKGVISAASCYANHSVLIIHEVDDYDLWRLIFDDAESLRKEAGELSFQLLVSSNDPNHIFHFSEWTSLAAARAFFESDQLAEIRKAAGVKSPAFFYLNEIDSGIL